MSIEALEQLGEAAEKLTSAAPPVPESFGVRTALEVPGVPVATSLETAPEAQAANWELIDPGGRQFETPNKADGLRTLLRVREETALSLQNQEVMVLREQMELATTRERLGLTESGSSNQLASGRELERLKATQEFLEQKRREILRGEIEHVWQEKITATFEVFQQMSKEQFAIVLETGKIPTAFEVLLKFLSALFGKSEKAPQMETRYTIILAQAFERGLTTVEQISTEFPQFVELETELAPVVVDLATEQILQGPDQKLVKDAPARPEITYQEPRQIAENSSASDEAPATSGGGGVEAVASK